MKTKNKVFKDFRPTLGYGFVVFVVVGFPEGLVKNLNKLLRKPKIQKKTKETPTNLRENQQNKVFKGFRPTLGYVFLLLLVSPKVFRKPKNFRENQKYKRKHKKTTNNFRENNKTHSFYRFQTHPWIWVCFFCLFVFPEGLKKNNKNLRENQKYKRKPKKPKKTKTTFGKTQKNKFLKVSDPPLDMGLFLLFVWFPRRFSKNHKLSKTKNPKENQRNHKQL